MGHAKKGLYTNKLKRRLRKIAIITVLPYDGKIERQ